MVPLLSLVHQYKNKGSLAHMKNYSLLVIDDRPVEVQEIIDTDFSTENYNVKLTYEEDFKKAKELYNSNYYDLIVLDIKKDPGEEKPGRDIFLDIWSGANSFVPVIVFTAHYDTEIFPKHNLISVFGKNQEREVKQKIKEYLNSIEKINIFRKKLNYYLREGLRVVNMDEADSLQLQRMANYVKNAIDMDEPDEKFPANIQYISLPSYKTFITCDIIETIPQKGREMEYYMIVSPWCELNDVDKETGLEKEFLFDCKKIISYPSTSNSNIRWNDGGFMNKGSFILLPDFKFESGSVFHRKVVDLQNSKVIKKTMVSKNANETDVEKYFYRKIASIASPFRERIINYSYQNRSRIGVPNIDENSWWGA